jgi:hypothetical protein
MDILNQIINGLNKEQVRFFKMYLSRIETKDDRKDVRLFDYIRKTADRYNDEKIFNALYASDEKNSFYRLKNRLMREVNKSLTLQHFDDEAVTYIFRLLALVKFYLNKNALIPAHYFLRKAEAKAHSLENLELLDFIYGEYIRMSRELMSINPEHYITLRKENLQKLNQVRTIDDVLAAVTYRLKVTQNFSSTESPVLQLLQQTVNDFTANDELKKSPLFRFKIYHAVSQVLLQSHQYQLLEDYLLKTYQSFSRENLFNKNNHETKLQMLIYLVNAFYKNNKLKKSLTFSGYLLKEMKAYNNMLYDKFLFYYYNSLVINYSKLDKKKSVEILKEMQANEKIGNNTFYKQFIYLNLSLAWFDLKEFHLTAKSLTKLYLLNDFKDANSSLRLRVAITDLMTRFELNDWDTFEYKLKQFKKDFKEALLLPENDSEKMMMDILGIMAKQDPKRKKILLTKTQQFLSSQKTEDADKSGLINYSEWLTDKVKKITH